MLALEPAAEVEDVLVGVEAGDSDCVPDSCLMTMEAGRGGRVDSDGLMSGREEEEKVDCEIGVEDLTGSDEGGLCARK